MCFSATASFVAGSALSAVGVAALVKAPKKAEIPFAIIPLLFGIQQFIEGIIWYSFRFDVLWLNTPAVFIYLLFAYVFWPVYVPFAVRSLETVAWRRKLLLLFQLFGVVVGAYFLYFQIKLPVTAQIINRSIVYSCSCTPRLYTFWILTLYFIATCISTFFSSHRLVNIIGLLVFISAAVSYQFYAVSFVSVWCFFVAVLSVLIFWYFRRKTVTKGRIGTD